VRLFAAGATRLSVLGNGAMVSASTHRARWRTLCSALVLACTVTAPCFGHGVTPELFSIEVHGEALTVATNFGILSNASGSWFNACDEVVGGPLLRAWARPGESAGNRTGTDSGTLDAATGDATMRDATMGGARQLADAASPPAMTPLAYTLNGVFAQSASDQCVFEPVELHEGVYWQMDHGIPLRNSSSDDASPTADTQFALIVTSNNDANHLLRAAPGEAFESIAFLGDGAGYRDLQTGGSPLAVYVTGYTLVPPVYKIAYSLDGGRTLREVTPAFDPTAQRLVPLAVDSYRPYYLYLTLNAESAPHAQLWRFDARNDALEVVFELAAGERLVGISTNREAVFLGATTDEQGVLYRANVESPDAIVDGASADAGVKVSDFARLSTEPLPPLACVTATESALFLCSSDFSRNSPFVVAESRDLVHFEPRLRTQDLGVLASCGAACELTSNWLAALFGAVAFPPDLGPGSPRDAGEVADASNASSSRPAACDCRVSARAPIGSGGWMVCLVVGLALTCRWARRQRI
jgi:hypothetical protein